MRIFRPKPTSELEGERCPYCREPVPDGAAECMMCGAALPQSHAEGEEAGQRPEQDSNLRPTP
jgi:predicted amidophosphoribosyltransferase